MESRHINVWINRPASEVYRYVGDPRNLQYWAAGLAHGEVTRIDGRWVAHSPMGLITIEFAPANDFGVLDHVVTLPGGESVSNPMRVVPAGPDCCEVVFTLRRRGLSDQEYDVDAAAVAADLATLKRLMEVSG